MALAAVHFNNNVLCSIDIETTGLVPGKNEVIQIAVVPLAPDITVSKNHRIFEIRIKPENLHHIDQEYGGSKRKDLITDCLTHGMERWAAVDYFSQWFYKTLKLPPNKKITPLGCNYESFDYPFLVEFFGGMLSYQEFFRSDVRDVQRCASMLNDLADWRSEVVPFSKINLQWLTTSLGVKNERAHDAVHDAVAAAEVYRRMMAAGQFYVPQITDKTEEIADQYAEYRIASVGKTDILTFHQFRSVWAKSFGREA